MSITETITERGIYFDDARIMVAAENVSAAREMIPEVRVLRSATSNRLGVYEAPTVPRVIQALRARGVDVPRDVIDASNEFVRQIKQIELLRSRLFEGDLPDLSRFVARGTELRRVQRVGACIALSADRSALFMDMGTGKTLTSLVACARRFEAHGLRRVLVVAPATVAGGWASDIQRLAMREQVEFVHAAGSPARRRRQYARAKLVGSGDDYMSITAISYGSLANDADTIIEMLDPQMVILDESHYVKNLTSSRSLACLKIANHARWVTLLTGTPYSEQPTDIFSQYSILDWRVFGGNRDVFVERFCKTIPNFAGGGMAPDKVMIDAGKEPLLNRAIYTIGFRAKKEDVLDLPAKRAPIMHEVELSAKSLKLIKQLRKDGLAQLDAAMMTGESAAIVANTRMVIGLRVQQAAGGFAKVVEVVDGVEVERTVSVGSEKLDALRDLATSLKAEGESVVVFAKFRAEIAAIEDRLAKIYGAANVSRIDGSVPANQRAGIVNAFQTSSEPQAMVLQVSSGAAGITLTRARHAVYYSMGYSATDYWQSQDRTHRIGQDRECFYHLLVAAGSDDKVTIDALANKRKVADAVIESWRRLA